ncbi:MAG: thiamine pyrophosphate-binding protein [Alphaproteobacteria bacterium]|nr:thiamine pyrophosphate-binding protein [Alphaproteobacteria bacterium]
MNTDQNLQYSAEKNVQILISLLKAHHIRYVIASPGTANAAFIASIQNDHFFTIYSAIDERSAAYMACGLAAEAGEPVVISCTGATAARNYVSGLTEAYYRKLPIVAINSMRPVSKLDNLIPQMNDQSILQNDIALLSCILPVVKDNEDIWECEVKINRALLQVKHSSTGPVHILLPSTFSKEFIPNLPEYRAIFRVTLSDTFPKLEGKVAVIIGSRKTVNKHDSDIIERFAIANHAPIFCEHISNYSGKNKILYPLAASQEHFNINQWQPDILIHIGNISGSYSAMILTGKQVWRVTNDGAVHDTFRKLKYVFEMSESVFFEYYTTHKTNNTSQYFELCHNDISHMRFKMPELAFSTIWVASKLAPKIPQHATIHLAILNSMRSWNFFELDDTIKVFSNVGGFGIDGCLSAFIGASLTHPNRLYFCFMGDLAFFYDMNVLGNRHIANNIRILVVNNGLGMEFKNYDHHAAIFKEQTDTFIAAKGHFGYKSPKVLKHYAEDLGFTYFAASNTQEFNACYESFLNPELTNKPLFFEIFTDAASENCALKSLQTIVQQTDGNYISLEDKNLQRYQ